MDSNSPYEFQQAIADFSVMAPFVTGTGALTRSGPPETQVGDRPTTRRDGTFAMSLKARIDGVGEVFWPGDLATIYRVGN